MKAMEATRFLSGSEMRTPFVSLLVLVLLSNLMTSSGWAEETRSAQADLTEVPIESLMEIEVTSVSKKAEKLSASPAAISVITQDDIRRSGATSLPEALRLAPGLDV